jgi:hypothetical protein
MALRRLQAPRRGWSRESGQAAPSRFAAPHRAPRPRPDATTDHPMTAPCSRRMRPTEGKPGTDAPTTHALERTPRGTRRVLGHERSTRTSPRARSATSEKARHESPCDHDDDRPLDVAPGVGSSGPTLPREQVPVGSAALESQRGNPSGAVPATKVARSGTNESTHLAGSPAGSLAGSPARGA